MAKKSKTQKAKASAARAQKRAEQEAKVHIEEEQLAKAEEVPKPKRTFFRKTESSEKSIEEAEKKSVKKEEKKPPKKKRFAFFSDVRAELRRVTWPSRQDVFRWSLVVVGALVFFGVYVLILDNLIVTPLLVAISGLGA